MATRLGLGKVPIATTVIAAVVTAVSLVELAMGRGDRLPDRLTVTFGLWPAHLPREWWRLMTSALVNPAYRTETVSFSVFDHWAVNIVILVSAGRRVERRLGSWAVVGAGLAGTLALNLYTWASFPIGGPGGGTSGASFGLLGASMLLGVRAGGGYRRYALTGLAVTVLILSWMFDQEGLVAHCLAMAAGAVFTLGVVAGWRPYRRGALTA